MPTPGPLELVIILVIALLILGPGKLPEVGSSLGKSIREFRKASSDVQDAVNVKVDTSPVPPDQARTETPVPVAPVSPTVVAPVPGAPIAPVAPLEPLAGTPAASESTSEPATASAGTSSDTRTVAS